MSVYFDSKSFKDANGKTVTPPDKSKLVNILPRLINANSSAVAGNGLHVYAYDTWLPIKITLNDGKSISGNKFTLCINSDKDRWGITSGNWDAPGFTYDVYIDNIVVNEGGAIFNNVDKVDNGTTTTYTSRLDQTVMIDGKGIGGGTNNKIFYSTDYVKEGYGASIKVQVAGQWPTVAFRNFGIEGFRVDKIESFSFYVYNTKDTDIVGMYSLHSTYDSFGQTTIKSKTWTKVTITAEDFAKCKWYPDKTAFALTFGNDFNGTAGSAYFVYLTGFEVVLKNA